MINRLYSIRHYAGKLGRLLVPFFCVALVLAAKTLLFTGTVGLTSPVNQLLPLVLGTGGVLLVVIAISVLLAPRLRLLYLLIVDVLGSTVILFDLMFFRYFQDVITIRTFPVAWFYLNSETVWWKMLRLSDVFLVVDFLLLGGWWIYKNSNTNLKLNLIISNKSIKIKSILITKSISKTIKSINTLKFNWATRLLLFTLLLSLGWGGCVKAYYLLEKDQPGITRTLYAKTYISQSVGEWEFHFLDIWRNFKTRLPQEAEQLGKHQREAALANWLRAEHSQSLKNDSCLDSCLKVKEETNLIVIQLESFQEFVIGKNINGQEITPNLNRLSKESLYFNNYFGETWDGGTSDAEFMSNVSLYPVSVGNAYLDYPGNNYVCLAKVLREKGYQTVVMEADQPGFWNMGLMLHSEGFQKILDENDFVHDLDIGMGLADNSMFQQGADYLEKLPQPFYSFLVTLSSHYPFLIPDKYKTINVEPYQDKDFGHYLEAVHYTDQALGCFLDRLQAAGLLDKSILAIYGDHQAPFTRDNPELRKFLGYGDGGMDDYQWLALQKVPLLIHLPPESELVQLKLNIETSVTKASSEGFRRSCQSQNEHFAAKEESTPTEAEHEISTPTYRSGSLDEVDKTGAIQTGVIDTVGGHVDLFPTILGLLGEDAAMYPLLGRDLLNSHAAGLAINRCGLLVAGDVLLDMSKQKVYQLQSGKLLVWEDFKQEQQKYHEYLENTDLIMKYDLQQGLFRHLIVAPGS